MTEMHFASERQRREHFAQANHFTPTDLADVVRQLGEFTLAQIKIANAPLLKRIKELEVALAEVQASATKFCGVFQRSVEYRRGSLVVHDNALWCAISDTIPNSEPGISKLWQLAVKSARENTRAPTSARSSSSVIERRHSS